MTLRRSLWFAGALACATTLHVDVRAQDRVAPETQASNSLGDVSFDPARASILRHRAWHEEFMPDQAPQRAGFRNPGNVGRNAEYYPPGNQFQNPQQAGSRHITAQIGNGGVPDRASQIAAYNAGTQRYNALQTHIDRYGRPMHGFGMGFGFGIGF